MALDGDLIRKQNINTQGVGETTTTPETTVAPSPTPTPIPVVTTSSSEVKKQIPISNEARAQAEEEAQETRQARAAAHSADVGAIAVVKLKNSIIDFLKNKGKEGTDTEIYEYLRELKNTQKINNEELQLLAEYEKSIEDGTFKPESQKQVDGNRTTASEQKTPASKNVIDEKYVDILKDENATPEQKVKNLLSEYYAKNDPEFSKLSKEEQEKFIEQKIKDDISKLNPDNENLSDKDIKKSYMKIALLIVETEKDNTHLDDLLSKPANEINNLVNKGKKEIFALFIEKLQNEKPEEVFRDSIRMYLSVTDENFASKSKNEQSKIVEDTKEKFSNYFNLKGTTPETKEKLKNIGINVLQYLSDNNISIEEFSKMSENDKDIILYDAFVNERIYDKLDAKTKRIVDNYSTLRSSCLALGDGEHTYGEVYEYLDKLNKNNELSDEELALYNQLKEDIKNNVFDANEKVSFKSNIIKALLSSDVESNDAISVTNSLEEYIKDTLKEIKPNTDLSDEQISDLIAAANNDADVDQTNIIIKAFKDAGWSDENIQNILDRINIEKAVSHSDDSQGVGTAALSDFVNTYSSQERINKVAHIVENIMQNRSDQFGTDYLINLNNDRNRVFTDAATRGINNDASRSNERKLSIYTMAFANSVPERRAVIAQSSIETASKEQKLYYGSEYAQIKDSYVTQGLAAATYNETDSQVKLQLNSYVSYAIKNNGYSADEVKNINTARETGQTSYERNASSTDSTNSSSKTSQSTTTTTNPINNSPSSTSNTSTASSSGGSAQTKPSASSASSAKVNISPANSNTVSQLRTQLAQIQYEHSIALRDKAIDGLQNIIDKIQNDQQVRAQKQAELAAKEAKTDAEISQAIKEAETKSAQEQKKAEEQVAKETLAQIEEQEQLEKKYNISIEKINKLKSAARNGDLATIYTELGTISADVQKHFVQYLSRKDTATIIGFIRNRSTDKSLIKELCRLNPGLIKSLDASMLIDCGIAKADIIKYSDSHQLAVLMYDLAKVGNTRELNLFYEALGDDAPAVASNISQPVPGDDRYFANLYRNMSTASSKVAMRYDIDKKVPRELWG